jgi:hypothetical protein
MRIEEGMKDNTLVAGNRPMRNLKSILARLGLILAMVGAGCQTPAKPAPPRATTGPAVEQVVTPKNLTPEQQAAVDPCALRLQDICGAILTHYIVHRELPAKLEELKALADVGTDLKFTCPVSKLPYVYVPAGLQSMGRTKRIVLHDAEPSHDGNRWCVLMAPIRGGKAPYLEVILMPSNLFRTYLPISETQP